MSDCIACSRPPVDPVRPYQGLGPMCRACFVLEDERAEALEHLASVHVAGPEELEGPRLDLVRPEPAEAPPARLPARRAPPATPPAWIPPRDWSPAQRRAARRLFARGFVVDELGRVARCG